MLEEQTALITLLREVIKEYDNRLNEVEKVNNSAVITNKNVITDLKNDINNIINIDLKKLLEVLEELNISKDDQEEIYSYLEAIKKLLKLNEEEKTTYFITDNQLSHLKTFFEKVDEFTVKSTNIQKENMVMIGKISSVCSKYKKLLKLVEEDNDKFINDLELIDLLFSECEIDDKTKKSILINIMKYNKNLYEQIITEQKEYIEDEVIEEDELDNIFSEYGYNYNLLDEEIKKDLLVYGNLNNIEEMFKTLKELDFNLLDDLKILVIILINCEKSVFENVLKYSISRGFNKYKLLEILPALIAQSNIIKTDSELLLSGRSDDFVKNVEFFEKVGIDLDLVFTKCKELFLRSNYNLVINYNALINYGFSFDELSFEDKFTPTLLSSLLSNNFVEVADQLIEICPEGNKYLLDNLGEVNRIFSSQDIILYNIYASYMEYDYKNNKMTPEGPFVRLDLKTLKLRDEITRYPGSGYETIPYRDIEINNKKERTMISNFDIKNMEIFIRSVEKSKYNYNLKIFDMDDKVKKLEEFIDHKNPIKYNFNGVYISCFKVNRIFNILKNYKVDELEDSLLFAITYNSLLDDKKFEKIKNLLISRGY